VRNITVGVPHDLSQPYLQLFYSALRRCNVDVVSVSWSGRHLCRVSREIDYLHLHWPSFLYRSKRQGFARYKALFRFVLFCLFVRTRGVRVVWTAHNLYPHDFRENQAIDAFARRLVVWLSSVIAVHGYRARLRVAEEFPTAASKLVTIVHGNFCELYADEVSKSEARDRLGIPEKKFVFLFFGICKEYKNIEGLIEAFREMKGDVTLVVAGQFQSERYLESIRKLAASAGDVRIHARHIDNDAIQVFMKSADVVVLPYRDILTSGAAVLALGFGKPVIAPDKGCLSELINEEVGLLYSGESQALRDCMNRALGTCFDSDKIKRRALSLSWEESAVMFAEALRNSL